MARPPVPKDRQHTESIRVWLTPEEKLAIELSCAAQGQTASAIGRLLYRKFLDGDLIAIQGHAKTAAAG